MNDKGKTMTSRKGKQIFLGNGDASGAECYKLHKLLEEALSILSGVQQAAFEDNESEMDHVRMIAADIYVALTGERIKKSVRSREKLDRIYLKYKLMEVEVRSLRNSLKEANSQYMKVMNE